jgi:hypothetical protein
LPSNRAPKPCERLWPTVAIRFQVGNGYTVSGNYSLQLRRADICRMLNDIVVPSAADEPDILLPPPVHPFADAKEK